MFKQNLQKQQDDRGSRIENEITLFRIFSNEVKNPLDFWETQQKQFPILSAVARNTIYTGIECDQRAKFQKCVGTHRKKKIIGKSVYAGNDTFGARKFQ